MVNMKKVFVSGCYDIVHGGHIEFFTQAKKYGDYLIVSVANDKVLEIHKDRKSSLPVEHKVRLLKAISIIDEVVVGDGLEPGLDFKEHFLQVDYNTISGTELDSQNGTYNTVLSKDSVLKHAGWLAAVEGDEALLRSYTNRIFTELKRRYNTTEGMGFWVCRNTPTDELRTLVVSNPGSNSNAYGYNSLNSSNSFIRRSPSLDTSQKK